MTSGANYMILYKLHIPSIQGNVTFVEYDIASIYI